MCRIRSCVSVVGRRQDLLRRLRRVRHSTDVDLVHGARRAAHDHHVVHVRSSAGRPRARVPRPLRSTGSRLHRLLLRAGRRLSDPVSCLHHRRDRLELPRRFLLLLHLHDHDRARRLHPGRPAAAAQPTALQDLCHTSVA